VKIVSNHCPRGIDSDLAPALLLRGGALSADLVMLVRVDGIDTNEQLDGSEPTASVTEAPGLTVLRPVPAVRIPSC